MSSKKFIGKNLIIFFYPKDYTPGCTTEVCNFRCGHCYNPWREETMGVHSLDENKMLSLLNQFKK